MSNEFIDRIDLEMQNIGEDASDPMHRLISMLKISLKEYPSLKESFFSKNSEMKNNALQNAQWIINRFEEEFRIIARRTSLKTEHLLALLFQSEKITPQECQLFMHARGTILEQSSALFKTPNEKRVRQLPVRVRI